MRWGNTLVILLWCSIQLRAFTTDEVSCTITELTSDSEEIMKRKCTRINLHNAGVEAETVKEIFVKGALRPEKAAHLQYVELGHNTLEDAG